MFGPAAAPDEGAELGDLRIRLREEEENQPGEEGEGGGEKGKKEGVNRWY